MEEAAAARADAGMQRRGQRGAAELARLTFLIWSSFSSVK